MLRFFEILFEYFERVLFDVLDDCDYYEIENNYPFSEKNTKNEINYDCSDSDDSEDNSDVYTYVLPFNGYKITRRNIAFC